MRTYLFFVIHIPTGVRFARNARFDTLKEFYEHLCKWNTQQPEKWAYAPTGDAS